MNAPIADQQTPAFTVPLIDITPFQHGDAAQKQAVAAQIDCAAREVGFMQITGHGIPDSAIVGLQSAIDGFFSLPAQQKLAWQPPSVDINRGYNGPLSERLSYSLGVTSPADLFEAFNVGTQASAFPALKLSARDYPANIWPDQPPAFQQQVQNWFDHAGALAHRLTRIFAVALDLPETYFIDYTDHSVDMLRINHYQMPAADQRLEAGQMGMGAHTDYGIVTILWADRVTPGLQILDSGGTWHDVTPAPGALLINLGDMLARWTNDRWRSTMHRVLAPVDAAGRMVRRRSAAYFHDGNADALISCLPGCTDDTHPPLYAPVTVAEHLTAKLEGSRGLALNPDAVREAARLKTSQSEPED
ncbi:2-oxoglutarate and iron-dependent oxygenase domain-containing protein [Herbaspirillum sp. RTI4]|uniref:isopenicillin N synthase family dioxygenase n=1 Tax=Herbaspirillum sp. RTI4 TaxID=3048640 RepID=UPI002AB59122|nr:2-oxoglutarate and iron-dependent oxygenase domain-containing protein [Herbaspirillum sp. RTI4]MDY7576898.1 2-oxoglutarate and iron-dependent oxygenase domain-containing protein [Herbaspirillum sp. RTI4]MEA9982496.1 2-oxoglutarate and iron-dependent oxygenase domain-containing protein [Herbaspirillum sp. RTI4]